MGEITVILILALIFLGPKKLPELASGLGKLIREIRKTTADVKNEIQLDEAIRKPFEELRDAVTLHPEELKRRDRVRRDMAELQRQAEELAKSAAMTPETAAEHAANQLPEHQQIEDRALSEVTPPPPDAPTNGAHAALETHAPPHVAGAGGEAVPSIPGTAPLGTVARELAAPPAPVPAPPAPPPEAGRR